MLYFKFNLVAFAIKIFHTLGKHIPVSDQISITRIVGLAMSDLFLYRSSLKISDSLVDKKELGSLGFYVIVSALRALSQDKYF